MKKLLSSLLALSLALSLAVLPASALELEDAKQLLAAYYVDGVSDEILALDDLDAILEAIGDPYTFYMTPEQYQSFNQSVNGQTVVGIGATVETAFDGGYRIMSVLPNSPAMEAGIQPGDILTACDGVPLSADVDPRVPIVGEEGTPLTLTLNRNGEILEFSLVRRAVKIPIVTYEQKGAAGVIDCISFGATTAQSIQRAIREMDDDAAVWIVDLRSNPGGDSGATAASASLFAGGGIMLYFRDGAGDYNYTYTLPNFPDMTDKPVIVLTSEHSASGSELFAGDMRTYRTGITLGQRTFGKGTAQIIFDETNTDVMTGGEAMKITTYRFFSPDGATNHVVGVLPTLLISPENTEAAAMLLTTPKPTNSHDFLKLELAGQTFYTDIKQAVKTENRSAFIELLEALPPSAKLYEGAGAQRWEEITPALLAQRRGLSYAPRTFSDTAESPYAREIDTMAVYGLLNGYEDGTFRPDGTLTRAQFSAMVASALDLAPGKGSQFSDVAEDAWYAGAVSAMTGMGFLSGRGDGTFGPDDAITCQEMVAALNQVAAWTSMEGYELNNTELTSQDQALYSDWASWAQAAARNLDGLEALPDELVPAEFVTRELAAATLCRLMEHTHLIWE